MHNSLKQQIVKETEKDYALKIYSNFRGYLGEHWFPKSKLCKVGMPEDYLITELYKKYGCQIGEELMAQKPNFHKALSL